MILRCFDGGVLECAEAVFIHRELAGVFPVTALALHGDKVGFLPPWASTDEVAIEVPQLDSRPHMYVIPLALHVAVLAGACRVPVYLYAPSREGKLSPKTPGVLPAWKGSIQKPVHHHRIWQALTPVERAVFPEGTEARIAEACRKGGLDNWRKPGATYYGSGRGSEVHNYLDAVGLGMHHLGRYSEVGNISRGKRSKRA